MAGRRGRLPSWLLIIATGALCAGALLLDSAGLFPSWRLATAWSPSALPSTRAIPAAHLAGGLPVLSLTLAPSDLYGERGILSHKLAQGKDWERPGDLSYFEGGRLLFASGVGVRIHGGSSRASRRPGVRLYFRRRYGAREFAPGVIFERDAQPIRRLVVHDDVRRDPNGTAWHLVNPFAYDIADAMGALAPDTKPVRFFLNGENYGVFVLTERFDERFFAAHWGYDDVSVDQAEFDELWAWVWQTRPLTMEAVARQVDLESLTRWFLAVAFCATEDAYQGPGQFLDQTRSEHRWFWVNWDMDRSFRHWNLDSYQDLLEPIAEQRRGRNRAEPRATILTLLLAEDAAYRDYFKRVFLQVMNHRVTDAFLDERYQHYAATAARLGVENVDYLPRLREFLSRRPAFFRLITEQWLNSPPSQPVTLAAPRDVALMIDGERVVSGYRGMYFPDLKVAVDVPAEYRARFSGWVVNGRRAAATPRLVFEADGPTQIEALFDGAPPASTAAAATPAPASVGRPDLPQAVWRRIPAGSFLMGCLTGEPGCNRTEWPRHQIRIEQPFEMMDREVAARDFGAFAAAAGRQMPRQPDWYADATHPVVNVTWDEAQAYCSWVGGSLPTEEQWEYAGRGGLEGKLFPWGDQFQGEANGRGRVGADRWSRTAPVGSFEPNRFGLRDMIGNVWEWTASAYTPTYDASAREDGYDLRTIRGGSWDSRFPRLRVAARAALSRRGRYNLYVGFRCIRTPTAERIDK